ncbi:MAG: 1-deoxy-D-xylulose-5-phosphate reductoisomerase [Eubacteriales bacterium]|jgi:1-deoxy-D-xylulose-5-phosphate reductoisomerase
MKKIAVLGSTGSIGTQTLQVVRHLGNYQVCALAAGGNVDLIEKQAREFHVPMVALTDPQRARELKDRLADTDIQVMSGVEGMVACAAESGADVVLSAIMGIAGLTPTVAAIRAHKTIALANKETLVAGGDFVTDLAKSHGVAMLPVDSEHSAIFQSMQGCQDKKQIKKLLLTASGGPFFGWTREQLQNVTVAQALKHPNWSMGAKITIDSATLMNKGLEFIEAMRLFSVRPDQIQVVVHRESIIHSMVEYADNSILAQLGSPDMAHPIQYALTYPDRLPAETAEVDFAKLAKMTFYAADTETFRCLALAMEAARQGGSVPCALNGANEAAVALFLRGSIGFLDIADLVEGTLEKHQRTQPSSLEEIGEIDRWARRCVEQLAQKKG